MYSRYTAAQNIIGKELRVKNLFISLIVLVSASCTLTQETVSTQENQPSKFVYESYLKAGDVFPLTSKTTIDGEIIDFTQTGQRKLVILFATWCSDSQRAMKALHESELINDQNIQIVAIARENTVDEVKAFREERNLKVTLVADEDRSIYKQFANAGIPRFIMIDENNLIANEVLAEGEEQLAKIKW